jgi:Zn-dependent protease with chaperone function
MRIGPPSIFLLLFLFFQLGVIAQLRPVYTFQQDDTLLKRAYYNQVMEKKKGLISPLDKKDPKASDYKTIYEGQYNDIGELVTSSRTVTDNKADKYLQSIVQKIISANDELKSLQLRVMFTRDWWPNAYSMGDGTIAFNAGLFIYLDNEAEMVFALSHELAHYFLDHSNKTIAKHVETINSETFKAEIKKLSKEEYMVNEKLNKLVKTLAFDNRRHSRENEAEADRYAYRFMKKTGYDCNAIKTCLELLDRVDDSMLYKPVVLTAVFDFPGYPFKKRWIQKESSIFSQLSKDDSPLTQKEKDSLKSHPDCAKRILLLEDSIKTGNGKKFIVSEALFRELQQDFPVEIMEQNYRQGDMSRQLYYSLVLLQQQQYLPVAVYSIARTLNEMYDRQKNHTLGTRINKEDRFLPQDYNLLLRMLDRLRLDEIAALSYNFCNKYRDQMSGYDGFEKEWKKSQQLNK